MSVGAAGEPAARRLERLLAGYRPDAPPTSSAGAAVLVVLRSDPERMDLETLLLQRTVHPADPASGQVALPGGRTDPEDADLAATALREAEEEVGVRGSHLIGRPLYVGTRPAPAFGLSVGVFAAPLAPEAPAPVARDPEEVDSVFWMPSRRLHDSARVPRVAAGGRMEVEATVVDQFVLWGFTRNLLREFFGIAAPSTRWGAQELPPAHAPVSSERAR